MYCCQHIRRNGFTGLSVFVRKRDYIFFSYRKGGTPSQKRTDAFVGLLKGNSN